MDFIKILLISCIPAIITGAVTYLVAYKNATAQIKVVEEQNKHDLDKLMEQHKIDIDSLNNKSEEKTIKTENVQKLVRKLKRKRDRMTLSLYKNVYRLKKAFPAINTKEITEILNKKIQIRKNKKNT